MEILDKFNIKTDNEEMYQTALTHTSFANEHGKESYERLEYLGDAVLELVMSEYLYKNTTYEEGEMTKLRSHYVCENALYEYSLRIGLNEFLLLGNGEYESGGKFRKAIVADIFEALMGAIYLDLGYATARRTVLNIIVPYIEDPNVTFFSDYKSSLQEYVQTTQQSLIYDLVSEDGPAHDRIFTVEVRIDDIVYGTGVGSTKKEAEQEAAKVALNKLAR